MACDRVKLTYIFFYLPTSRPTLYRSSAFSCVKIYTRPVTASEPGHSPVSNAVINMWSYTSTVAIDFITWRITKHRRNSTFTFTEHFQCWSRRPISSNAEHNTRTQWLSGLRRVRKTAKKKRLLDSSCLCVCPSVRMKILRSHWRDFHEI